MHFFIENLKISNFLSFFGEYEIALKPFTAIMCNYYEGKDDLFRALEFVLGAELTELRVENPIDLLHKAVREEFLINPSIRSYVEVTVNMVQENKQQKFRKSIKNGNSSTRVEHRISGAVTPKITYEEKLKSLSLNIKSKNLIFYKSYFNNAIWGCPEDLERTIKACLRDDHLLEEWKRARKEMECLSELKRRTSEKNYNYLKKSHLIVAKYTDRFEKIRETIREKLLEDFTEAYLEDSNTSSSVTLSTEEEMEVENVDSETKKLEKIVQMEDLENRNVALTEKLHNLKLKESTLVSRLYHEEIKLVDEVNVLEDRIKKLKSLAQERENRLSEIWREMMRVKSDARDLSQKITSNLLCMDEIQRNNYLQNRLTPYGRFFEYLQPSPYLQLLKQIIGDEIYYSNLCDTTENALYCMDLMQMLRYEHRETFIVFQNYSHKLQDVLIASGEKGIQINTLEQLLIFLCKLKHFEIIEEVPIIIQKEFNYDDEMPISNDYTVYERSLLHFMSEGLISLKVDENSFYTETISELQRNLISLKADEDLNHFQNKRAKYLQQNSDDGLNGSILKPISRTLESAWNGENDFRLKIPSTQPEMKDLSHLLELKYLKWNDLLISRWETLVEMNSLENDISFLKRKLKRPRHNLPVHHRPSDISDIYRDYSDIFKESLEEWRKYERESQAEDQFLATKKQRSLFSDAFIKESINRISNELEEVWMEKLKSQEKLKSVTEELRVLNNVPLYDFNLLRYFVKFSSPPRSSRLFFEIEFNKLKILMADVDLEDFLGCQKWRNDFITSLIKDFIDIKKKFKNSMEVFKTISTARMRKLYPLLEHCSHYLSSTFNHLMDDALPLVKLNFSSKEESLHLMSSLAEDKINAVDVLHFNTFLKFMSVLTVFLEIAVFDKIPIMVLDEVEEFFPAHKDNLEAVLKSEVIEKIIPENQNVRFHLLMRVGQYLSHYIKKNTPGNHVRNNGNYKDDIVGPMQILYFTKEDFVHAAQHYIWIHSQILPDEYITENCNSYSEIHEIKFDKLVSSP